MRIHTRSGGVLLRVSGGALTIAAIALVALAGASRAGARQEQAAAAQPSFEVASIKPDHTGSGSHHTDYDHGRFVAVNITIKSIILRAYGMADYQISGAPDWVNSDYYDINAKMDDAAAAALAKLPPEQENEQYKRLFQSLLADRFNMKVTHEPKELPIFALVVAKGGIKFSPTKLPPEDAAGADSPGGTGQPRRGMTTNGNGRDSVATGYGVKLSAWAAQLSRQPEMDGRLVVDETGLTGEYDFTMKWSRTRDTGSAAEPAALDTSGPSLFTALQEQLGLRLEAKKGPVDTILIVHIDRPSEN